MSGTFCMIIHADVDAKAAADLYDRLKVDGFSLWMESKDCLPGANKPTEIAKQIKKASAVLVCVSTKSVSNAGELQKLIRLSLSSQAETAPGGIKVIPVRLDDCDLPDHVFEELGIRFGNIQQADLFETGGFERLIASLKSVITPDNPSESAGSNGSHREVIQAFEALLEASKRGNRSPAAFRIEQSLSICVEDLKSSVADMDMLASLPEYLIGLNADIEASALDRHFEVMPAREVLSKLEALYGKGTQAGDDRIESLDEDSLVQELVSAIGEALKELPSAGLETSMQATAETELRHLRREVTKPSYQPKVVSERRRRLEVIKVNLLQRTMLLTEALLGGAFPNMPTGTVFRYVAELWCPQFVMIPAGTFLMGSPHTEEFRWDREGPQHEVEFEQAFSFGRFAVTFDEFDHFCEVTGYERPKDSGWGRKRRPVINVSHNDALSYCEWLSYATGVRIQLPTESMWEYACRAGSKTAYSFGNSLSASEANFNMHHGRTLDVGSYPGNAWGLHEMHGNVWEWCLDRFHKEVEKPSGVGVSKSGSFEAERGVRGGCWDNDVQNLRSAYRHADPISSCENYLGFRCAGLQVALSHWRSGSATDQ